MLKNSSSSRRHFATHRDKVKNNNNGNEIEGVVKNSPKYKTSTEVNGQKIAINNDTKIQGTPAEGAEAEVEVAKQADGSLLATSIQIQTNEQDGDNNDQGNQIVGTIQSLGANNSNIVINGQTIKIDQTTEIDGQLAVGARAEVEVVKQADNSLLAESIEIMKNQPESTNHQGHHENQGEERD